MSVKSVAIASDTSATPGTILISPAVTGTWTAGMINTESYSKLTVSTNPVIYQASCLFTFSGVGPPPGNVPVNGTETVTLNAETTKLQKNENNVLRDGDSKTSSDYGNEISISASHKLKSA